MEELKKLGHRKINRGTIGAILWEVSDQISMNTNPSVYPTVLVVRKGTKHLGPGFWELDKGTNPPCNITPLQRTLVERQYRADVYNLNWFCHC